jgi:hypothetical protein
MARPRLYTNQQEYEFLLREGVSARFWKYVDKSGDHWLWTGASHNGYGRFLVQKGITRQAHRVSWMLSNQCSFPDEMQVLHRCDIPPCVHPDCLFIGTQDDNMKDMSRKGRSLVGETNARAKFCEDDIRRMRSLRSNGWSLSELAYEFNCGLSHVSQICNRQMWAHVV